MVVVPVRRGTFILPARRDALVASVVPERNSADLTSRSLRGDPTSGFLRWVPPRSGRDERPSEKFLRGRNTLLGNPDELLYHVRKTFE